MSNYIIHVASYYYCRPTTCFRFGMGIDDWLRSMARRFKKSRNVLGMCKKINQNTLGMMGKAQAKAPELSHCSLFFLSPALSLLQQY